MKPTYFLFFSIFYFFSLNAQVGINNLNPKATLDISAENAATPGNTEGVLIPRLDALPAINPTADQNGMLIFLNTIYSGFQPGFLYWDATISDWVAINTSANTTEGWQLGGNVIGDSDFLGTTNNKPINIYTNNNLQFSFTQAGQLNFNEGIEIGNGSLTGNSRAIAIGSNSGVYFSTKADGIGSISIGQAAQSSENNSIAIGSVSKASKTNAIAMGDQAYATAINSFAGGYQATAENSRAIALGSLSKSSGDFGISLGNSAYSIGESAIALGDRSDATATKSLAIGREAAASSNNSTALGFNAQSSGSNAIAVGSQTEATMNNAISIGTLSKAIGENATAIGNDSKAQAINATAIGNGAESNTDNEIVLGNSAITNVRTSGIMNADSFVATNSGTIYPDYVFEKYFTGFSKINPAYNLKSIEEAEAYVKEKGHLEKVASYEEIKKNDFKINLTQTSIANLEKIEEHFIYIVELNNTIKSLNQTLQNQNAENVSISKQLDKQQKEIKSLKKELEKLRDIDSEFNSLQNNFIKLQNFLKEKVENTSSTK